MMRSRTLHANQLMSAKTISEPPARRRRNSAKLRRVILGAAWSAVAPLATSIPNQAMGATDTVFPGIMNGQATGVWTDNARWSTGSPPGPNDEALDNLYLLGNSFNMIVPTSQSIGSLTVTSQAVWGLSLASNSVSFNVSGAIAVVEAPGGVSNSNDLNIQANGGSVTAGSLMIFGYSGFSVNGGNFTCPAISVGGNFGISNGTLFTNTLTRNPASTISNVRLDHAICNLDSWNVDSFQLNDNSSMTKNGDLTESLQVDHSDLNLPNGNVILSNSGLLLTNSATAEINGDVSVGSRGGLGVNSGASLSAHNLIVLGDLTNANLTNGTVNLSGGVINSTGSTMTFTGGTTYVNGTSSYSGPTQLDGNVVFGSPASIGGSGQSVQVDNVGGVGFSGGISNPAFLARINPNSTGTLLIGPGDSNTTLDFTTGPLGPLAPMFVGAVGNVTYTGALTPANNTYRLGGGGGTLNFTPVISGNASVQIGNNLGLTFVLAQNGTVVLGPSNTYTGTTTVSGFGTPMVLEATALANGNLLSSIGESSNAATNLVLNGATLAYIGSSEASTDRLFTTTGVGVIVRADGGALHFTNSGALVAAMDGLNQLTLAGNNTAINTFSPNLPDPALGYSTLTKVGTSTWRLDGAPKTYTGSTTISGGNLIATALANGGNASSIGASGRAAAHLILDGSVLTYGGAAPASTNRLFTLTPNGGSLHTSAGAVSFTNPNPVVFTGNGNHTLNLTGSNGGQTGATNTFSPSLSDPPGWPTSLNKSGGGIWQLNNSNTYSGPTSIIGGTLAAAHDLAIGTGQITISPGATLDLSAAGLSNAIPDGDTLLLSRAGGQFGTIAFGGSTLDETINELFVNGVTEQPGNYNAENLPNFITGSGSLTVRQAAPQLINLDATNFAASTSSVPEPVSMLPLIGGTLLMARRRRERLVSILPEAWKLLLPPWSCQ